MHNPYLPMPVTVDQIIDETDVKDIKTFRFKFERPADRDAFFAKFVPGQFAELSVLGKGEIPIGIASSPMQRDYVEFSIKKMGLVTTHMHNMSPGARMGIRGPLGNGFPMDFMENKNLVIIGGGFAFTTLRCMIHYALHPDNRARYGKITVVYGARSPGDLMYKEELRRFQEQDDIDCYVTVDKGDETWQGREGFVPTVTEEVAPSPENAVAIICGPPIMIKFTLPVMFKLGFEPETIINSLEMRMKCGIGKCGRCNIGNKYVCKDGPVFSYAQLQTMPQEF